MEGEKGPFFKQIHSLSSFYHMAELECVKHAIINAAKQGRFFIHWKLEATTKEFLQKEGFEVVVIEVWNGFSFNETNEISWE